MKIILLSIIVATSEIESATVWMGRDMAECQKLARFIEKFNDNEFTRNGLKARCVYAEDFSGR